MVYEAKTTTTTTTTMDGVHGNGLPNPIYTFDEKWRPGHWGALGIMGKTTLQVSDILQVQL